MTGRVVLAVESPTVQRVLGSVLGRAGYVVTPVGDGVEAAHAALSAAADDRPGEGSVLVAFAALPRLSGFALTRLLREQDRTADMSVILLTAPGVAAERHWATLCGADRALASDVEAGGLVAAVAEELARSVGKADAADRMDAVGAARFGGADAQDDAQDDAPDEAVLTRATEVLERALFETALVAEVTGLSSAGLGAEGAVAGLLGAVARSVDPAFVAVLTPEPALALVLVNQAVSRPHYRELLLRLAADATASTGVQVDAAAFDARAADPKGLLGSDELAHLSDYHAVPLMGVGGGYVGHLAVSARDGTFPPRVLRTLALLADPAGRLVATVTGHTAR